MKKNITLHQSINLLGDPPRIQKTDANRQEATARELLKRLNDQPGMVLADEVGMGKTFVALAVAVSVAIKNRNQGPVVVMVPSNILRKWEGDFNNFKKYCITNTRIRNKITAGSAEDPVSFFKLLDDPLNERKSIIFLSHSGMHREIGR